MVLLLMDDQLSLQNILVHLQKRKQMSLQGLRQHESDFAIQYFVLLDSKPTAFLVLTEDGELK